MTPAGVPYRANDPRLLDWVQATASFGFIEAYSRFARPLTEEQKSQAFAEAQPAARLYGARNAPRSVSDWSRMLDEFEPALEPSDIIFEFLEIMRNLPLGVAMRAAQRLLVSAAVEIVPADIRQKLGLSEFAVGPVGAGSVKALAHLAEMVPVRDAPPAQASVRLGLAPDFLYGGPIGGPSNATGRSLAG